MTVPYAGGWTDTEKQNEMEKKRDEKFHFNVGSFSTLPQGELLGR